MFINTENGTGCMNRSMHFECSTVASFSLEISSLLNIPQSAIRGFVTKWKGFGTRATQPRSRRQRKIMERGQRMLRHIVRRSHKLSAESIATDL